MSGGGFLPMIQIVLFLWVLWLAGRLCRQIHLSPIIGEILIGMMFGPNLLRLVPYVHGVEEHGKHIPSIWEIMGTIGVTLMIAESGTHIHFDKIQKVGVAALIVAVIGTFAPLGIGMGFAYLFLPNESWQNSFSAGCSLAPTSVGIALKLLTDAKQLNSLPGQTIVTAAFLDDVFSIILLVVLLSLTPSSSSGPVDIFLVCIYAFLFLAIGAGLSVYFYPKVIPWILKNIPEQPQLTYQPRDEIHLFFMLSLLVFYGYIGNLIGSHLLGAFVAGMSFSQVPRSMYVWRRQLKRIAAWLIRFFFACSVGFTIPVKVLFSVDAFWKGCVFAVVPTIIGKILAGLAAWEHKWIVGFAMVGRGEFAYLVAQQAVANKLLNEKLYAVVVWALLLAVLVAPVAFRWVLDRAFADKESFGMKYFIIQAEGHHHTGAHFEIVDVLHDLHLDILEAKVETDGDVDAIEFIVAVSGDDDLDEDKIEEVLSDIRQAINDDEAQVHILPVDEHDVQHLVYAQQNKRHASNKKHERTNSVSLLDREHMVEIRLMAKHEPHLLLEIVDTLYDMGIQVIKGHMEEYYHTDSEIIYGKPIYSDAEIDPVLDIHEIKDRLTAKLREHGLKNEVMVRPIHVKDVVMPHHVKMSDYMKTHRSTNNPFVDHERGACGYEIDIECEDRPKILHTISTCLQALQLDVREADVDDDVDNHQWHSTFFVQETKSDRFSPNKRRRLIERKLTEQFQRNNMEALVRVRPINNDMERSPRRASVDGIEKIDPSQEHAEPMPVSEHSLPHFRQLSQPCPVGNGHGNGYSNAMSRSLSAGTASHSIDMRADFSNSGSFAREI